MDNPITFAIGLVGLQPLAAVCGVTYQALRKWEKAGRLPRTEWTGETDYASKIAAACSEKGQPMSREAFLIVAAKTPSAPLERPFARRSTDRPKRRKTDRVPGPAVHQSQLPLEGDLVHGTFYAQERRKVPA